MKRMRSYANSSSSEKPGIIMQNTFTHTRDAHRYFYSPDTSEAKKSRDKIEGRDRAIFPRCQDASRLSDLGSFFYPALNKRKPPLSELIFHDARDAPRSRVSLFANRMGRWATMVFILTIVALQQVGLRRHPRIDYPAPVIWIGWI